MTDYLQTVFDKFELRVRRGYYYTQEGIWSSVERTRARIGVTDYAQRTGGDVAFVELAKEGSKVERQEQIGTLETAKATISLLCPFSGTVEQVNAVVSEKPELVNSDPYGEGWLLVLAPQHLEDDLKTLMSAEDYFELMLKNLESERKKLEAQ